MSDCDAYLCICALPLDVKRLEYKADHSPPSNVRVTTCEVLSFTAYRLTVCCYAQLFFQLIFIVDMFLVSAV